MEWVSTLPLTSNFKIVLTFRLARVSHPPKQLDGGLGAAS
jgi:hypothetical protein